MVAGLKLFIERFQEYAEQYVIIGGTACDLLLDSIGQSFRATSDIDMVLLVEACTVDFGKAFWQFILDGGYANVVGDGKEHQFYRFTKPKEPAYPTTIELFSKKPDEWVVPEGHSVIPVHLDDAISSLSAILLDDDYYELLLEGKTTVENCSVLGLAYLILFKMKAWLDLSDRRNKGEAVDQHTINKHKNDVFRLVANIQPGTTVLVRKRVRDDIDLFLDRVVASGVDLKNLRLGRNSLPRLLAMINGMFPVA